RTVKGVGETGAPWHPPRLGWFGAVFIMLKSALGAGLLNFPWAFQKAGGVNTAICVELVSLVFLISGLVILGYASSVSRQKTYQDVVREVCGRAVGQLCEVCFCFNLFMVCVAFLVVVQDQLEKPCPLLLMGKTCKEMPYHWYTDQRFALFILCLVIILPLSIPKEISIQKYTRYSTISCALEKEKTLCVCVCVCVCLQCHEASIAIYSSMENQKLSHWVFVAVVSMFFCLLIYTLTGEFTSEIKTLVQFVLHIISTKLICVYMLLPVSLSLDRSVILNLMLRIQRRRRGIVTHSFESRCRVILTVIWISITLLIAMFVPDMSKVISVIGGISSFFIFIFPGLCLVFTMQTESVTPRVRGILTMWGVITIVVGAFIFGQSTTLAVMELFHSF
uniref:Amino acid transporter transmembrane domain-containing protein n=1 Tax=Anabas testudineus TaxID=64144 RepID=A0A3Q1HDE5_ANATE